MKKIYLIILFILVYGASIAQVLKFRSYSSSIKTKGSYGWTKWSEPKDNNILIVFDLDKERVSIFSKEVQEYDIYKTFERETDKDGDYIYEYACVDASGLKCHIRWVKLNSQNGRIQVYVDFADVMLLYNVKSLE
jgi:hypothetical protein